jgi:hypothetical protein
MMEAARTFETLVNFYQTTRRYDPEDSYLWQYRSPARKFPLIFSLFFTKLFMTAAFNLCTRGFRTKKSTSAAGLSCDGTRRQFSGFHITTAVRLFVALFHIFCPMLLRRSTLCLAKIHATMAFTSVNSDRCSPTYHPNFKQGFGLPPRWLSGT